MYIQYTHTGRGMECKAETARSLDASMYCCISSFVLFTNNVCQPSGLYNGATGTVMDIVYVPGISAPGLPKFIIVYFGTNSRGQTFFPVYPNISGWLPIHPITTQWYTKPTKFGSNYEEHTQSILYLRLCWAWKIWNDQVQKI